MSGDAQERVELDGPNLFPGAKRTATASLASIVRVLLARVQAEFLPRSFTVPNGPLHNLGTVPVACQVCFQSGYQRASGFNRPNLRHTPIEQRCRGRPQVGADV